MHLKDLHNHAMSIGVYVEIVSFSHVDEGRHLAVDPGEVEALAFHREHVFPGGQIRRTVGLKHP